jgi:hypothetical protein
VIPLNLLHPAVALGQWPIAFAVCLVISSIAAAMLRHRQGRRLARRR